MIVDTSAVLAILKNEKDAAAFAEAIEANPECRMSVVNYVEAAIVLDRDSDPVVGRKLDALRERAAITLVPVDERQAHLARDAYRDFGKGSGHPAKLNFGDCFAYALAKATGEPLLYKGDDFSHTDAGNALPR
jgi:ribonuclease VapC